MAETEDDARPDVFDLIDTPVTDDAVLESTTNAGLVAPF